MPRLGKAALFARFEEAVRASGWNLLYLSRGNQPARYRISRDGQSLNVNVYIWNITPGGKGRAANEYRIQKTMTLTAQPGARNLVLGWWDDVGVFAGWDFRQHTGAAGSSPSMQVSEEALRPTVVLDARDPLAKNTRILAALCLHPIAYYSESWAGAMCPTDDVIAHLALMRGDEAMLWRRANQHPPHRPEAGL